jgi:hypothetical protein
MNAMFYRLGVVVAAALLSQCANDPAKGKETYGEVLPGIRAPQSLNYGGLTYTAGYSAANRNGVRVEYFPEGQGTKQWSQMLALCSIEKKTTPDQEVVGLAATVSTSGGNSHTHEGTGSSDRGLDFTISKAGSLEFNMIRYSQTGAITTSLQYAAVLPPETVRLGPAAVRAVAAKHSSTIMQMEMPEVGRQ